MPSAAYILNLIVAFVVNRTITVRMHTGPPGANGTQNEVAVGGYTPPDVVLAHWTIVGGDATITDNLSFGLFIAARDGISHYSLWDGNNFMSSRAFLAPMDVQANQIARVLAGTIEYSSTSIT